MRAFRGEYTPRKPHCEIHGFVSDPRLPLEYCYHRRRNRGLPRGTWEGQCQSDDPLSLKQYLGTHQMPKRKYDRNTSMRAKYEMDSGSRKHKPIIKSQKLGAPNQTTVKVDFKHGSPVCYVRSATGGQKLTQDLATASSVFESCHNHCRLGDMRAW